MEFTVKCAIVESLKKYMEAHNMKQADIAKKTNINAAYINIILKEDSNFMYDAGNKQGLIPARHFYAIAELIGYSITKEYWEVQPTNQMLAAISNLEDAKKVGSATVLIGETGCGKSFAAQRFATRNPHDTFIITVGSSDNLGDLIDKIIDVLKITAAKTKSAKLRDIAKHMKQLKSQGYTPQLIFDEAEYMKQPALCAIKELYDNLFGLCSLVLIGTDQLTDNLDKLRRRNKPGIPQFYRRIKFGIRQLPAIDRTFDIFISDLPKDLRLFLQRECDNYGELHDALVPALRDADRTGNPISVQLVKRVLNIPDEIAA